VWVPWNYVCVIHGPPLLASSRTAMYVCVSSVFVSLSRSFLTRVRASYTWEPVFFN
jgi:hypothetical protein